MRALSLVFILGLSTFVFLSPVKAQSEVAFACQCAATGPGSESGVQARKICAYDCNCNIGGLGQLTNKKLSLVDLVTSATSLETWDFGSQVCHGQYAWRPSLDAPNWRIQVRFAAFSLNSAGELTYEESVEIAPGIRSNIQRSTVAPEVLNAIKRYVNEK